MACRQRLSAVSSGTPADQSPPVWAHLVPVLCLSLTTVLTGPSVQPPEDRGAHTAPPHQFHQLRPPISVALRHPLRLDTWEAPREVTLMAPGVESQYAQRIALLAAGCLPCPRGPLPISAGEQREEHRCAEGVARLRSTRDLCRSRRSSSSSSRRSRRRHSTRLSVWGECGERRLLHAAASALTRQGARCLGPRHLAHTARVLLLSAGDDQPQSWPPAKGCACRPPGPHWAQPGPAAVAPGCGLGSACPHSHGRSTQASRRRAWGQRSRWGPSDTGVCSSGRRVSRAQGQGKRPGVRNPAPHPGFTSWTVDGRSLPRGAACSPGSRNVGTFRPRSSVRMGHGVC